ncbi:hypothetical protein Tco_0609264 [Tanacetum coccineum]
MEFVTKQARLILPYGMLLTRLFKYVMSESPELFNESYVLYDRVMYALATQQERKTRKDYGTKRVRYSTSSSSAFDQPSSFHLNDDNDGNDEGTSWPRYDSAFLSEVQTPSTSYVNLLFAKDKQEQKYPKQPKIINNTIGDDQIDSNIIFDEPNEDVNSGSVKYDNNVQESYE